MKWSNEKHAMPPVEKEAQSMLAECVQPGMLRAQFSPRNKLVSFELVFDAMGFINNDSIPNNSFSACFPDGEVSVSMLGCNRLCIIFKRGSIKVS